MHDSFHSEFLFLPNVCSLCLDCLFYGTFIEYQGTVSSIGKIANFFLLKLAIASGSDINIYGFVVR